MNMADDSKVHTVPIVFQVTEGSMVDAKDCIEVKKVTASGQGQAPERILRRTSREDNIRYTSLKSSFIFERQSSVVFVEDMHSSRLNDEIISDLEKNCMQEEERRPSRQNNQEINLALSRGYSTWSMLSDNEDDAEDSGKNSERSSVESIPSGEIEENDAKVAELETENKDKKPMIHPFKIVHKMHNRLSLIRARNEEHQTNEIASKTFKELDVSKYVDDNWELDETKLGLFPDDDYALTYKDDPDTLPALFEEDERFVFVDGLIQLKPEPVKPTFRMAFRRQSSDGSASEKKTYFAGTA